MKEFLYLVFFVDFYVGFYSVVCEILVGYIRDDCSGYRDENILIFCIYFLGVLEKYIRILNLRFFGCYYFFFTIFLFI